MNRNAKTGIGMYILIAIFITVILLIGYMVSQNGNNTNNINPTDITSCDSTTSPSFTINAYDKENPGTSIVETSAYRKVGTNQWTSFTTGTAITALDVGDNIEVVLGVNTTDADQIDNAYGPTFTYQIPCKESPSIEKEMVNDELEGSLTTTFYNADSNAGAETFSTGETQTVSLKLKSGTDEYYGNPYTGETYPNIICLNLNSSAWDEPEQVYLASDNSELKRVSTPDRHNTDYTVAGKIAYCYEAPVFNDKITEIKFDLNADDTLAPTVDDTGYIYAGGHFINADTGKVSVGVNDEDGTDVATSDPDTVTLDFT